LIAFSLAGCATVNYVAMTNITAQDVAKSIDDQSHAFKLFTSSGYGSFETPQGEYSARFDISIRRPSTTNIKLYGPFGIKVAQAKLDSDTLLVYNSLNNEVFVGKPTQENLRHFLVVAADGASLSDVLLDLMTPFTHLDSSRAASRIDGGRISFIYANQDTVETFIVDGEYMRMAAYEKKVSGKTEVRITYSDFTSVNNIYFPKTIFFEDLKHNISAKLFYQDIALNEKDEVQITVPPDAKEIFLN
jgi:outer membrane lipoprotein-sorting protein